MIMLAILDIKANNKDGNNFCREIEVTPGEYDNLCRITREVNERAGQACINVYPYKI